VVQRVAEEVIAQGDIDSAARYVWRKPDYSSVKPIALRAWIYSSRIHAHRFSVAVSISCTHQDFARVQNLYKKSFQYL
jgi:hypothetical protein